MANLLKLQFFRAIKSRQMILLTVFAILVNLLPPIITLMVGTVPTQTGSLAYLTSDASSFLLNIYSVSFFTGDVGQLLNIGPFFLILIGSACINFFQNDRRYGIVRNQIVGGYSRAKVYFSYYLVSLIIALGASFLAQLAVFSFSAAAGLPFDCLFSGSKEFAFRYIMSIFIFISVLSIIIIVNLNMDTPLLSSLLNSAIIPLSFSIFGIITVSTSGHSNSATIQNVLSFFPFQQANVVMSLGLPSSFGSLPGLPLSLFGAEASGIGFSAIIMWIVIFAATIVSGLYIFRRKEFK